MRPPRASWAAAGVLLLLAALAVHVSRVKSATFDEGVYLAAGYTHWRAADYRLVPVHPPLARLLAAAPLLRAPVRVEWRDASWQQAEAWTFAHRFLYRWNDADTLLALGRLPAILLTAALALALFLWVRAREGAAAGLLALFVFVLNPEVLAHGPLATNDMAVTAFVFAGVAAFERLTREATWPWLLATGLAAGAAASSKFSGLVLVPVLAALAMVAALAPEPLRLRLRGWPGAPGAVHARLGKLTHASGLLLVAALIALLVVWASYGFRFKASVQADAPGLHWQAAPSDPAWELASVVRRHRLLPEAYTFGFLDTSRRSQRRSAFLMGDHSDEGWWWFFPAAFALKTPLALLGLLALTLALGWRHVRSWRDEAFLWVPVAVYLAFALTSRVNIGLRLLLPLYPFLAAAVGRWGAWVVGRGRAPRVALALWAVWYASAAARIHPHYLAYFNELAGGPANGHRHLVDSSLDWGQDLKGLKGYLQAKGIPRVKLSFFGTGDPGYYGIPGDLLPGSMRPRPPRVTLVVRPGDVVAVSATNLQGVYLPTPMWSLMEQLRAHEPFGSVGYSILLWRVDFGWAMPPEEARDLGWLDDALRSYGEELAREPGWAEGHALLGHALHLSGHHRRALGEFEEALRLDPGLFALRPELSRAREAARARMEEAAVRK